jgi:hypothetical protein
MKPRPHRNRHKPEATLMVPVPLTVARRLSADHLVHGKLLDVGWMLRLHSRRRHPFDDPWSERIEVSAYARGLLPVATPLVSLPTM